MMQDYYKKVMEAAQFIKNNLKGVPIAGVITGTGLSECVVGIVATHQFDYDQIPHFPLPTVDGHNGRLLIGKLDHQWVLAFQGRFHLYEGYSARDVSFPVRVMQALGVQTLILSNAAGGLNPAFKSGDLMLLSDHINLTGENPLVGTHEDGWGVRFPDMSQVYDEALTHLAFNTATKEMISLQQGVYAGLKGPSLETPAEVRFLKRIGTDAVGFSTVAEAIAAKHGGMRILGISTITNLNDPDNPIPASVEEIIETANEAAPKLGRLIRSVIAQL
jgi:purine-nucleoside phosphorylase